MSPQTPPSSEWTQEIRFAVVLYGGVSLAIYINGVTQELFRMVRATADLPPGETLSGTERIYRELGQILFYGREPRRAGEPFPAPQPTDPIKTRFVVDILSGTSAGGINAVALAKALALKCSDMEALKDVWLKDADLETLLNDERSDLARYPSGARKTSLLNSEKMYRKLYESISGLNRKAGSPSGPGFADAIDLYITATDLNGLKLPIMLADCAVDERNHKAVFHFEYVDPSGGKGSAGTEVNDLEKPFDPMLAFAARCTSAFPLAFEPMTLAKIEPVLKNEKSLSLDDYSRFFQSYLDQGVPFDEIKQRPFADGGYLDVKPFSYAIDLIQYRTSCRPVQRKLLYVDPFPELADDRGFRADIGFVENAYLAAMGIPRYETIRGDIHAVNKSNRLQQRVENIRRRLADDMDKTKPLHQQNWFQDDYSDTDLAAMRDRYGECYPIYHHLLVYSVTDFVARVMTRITGFQLKSDEYVFIRALTRAWRRDHYRAYATVGKKTENAFLSDFDLDYRMRRLNYIRELIDRPESADAHGKPKDRREISKSWLAVRDDAIRQLASLATLRRQLLSVFDNPLRTKNGKMLRAIDESLVSLTEAFREFAKKRDETARQEHANGVYKQHKDLIDRLAQALKDELAPAFDQVRAATRTALKGSDVQALWKAYAEFHAHDMVSFALLEGTDAREYAKIEVYRVSPADGALKPDWAKHGNEKLAGTAVADFGGFLKEAWRWNDMMWGRLDGADRIITALLPDPGDRAMRQHYVKKAQEQILKEELTHGRMAQWLAEKLDRNLRGDPRPESIAAHLGHLLNENGTLAKIIDADDRPRFLKEQFEKPRGPSPEQTTHWTSRALKILGQMIDDLPGNKDDRPRLLSRAPRSLGVLLSQVVRFAVPGSLGSRFFEHWLVLIALAGLLLIIAAPVLGVSGVSDVGYAVVAGSIGFWLLHRLLGRLLKPPIWVTEVALLSIFAVALLAMLGVFSLGTVTTWACFEKSPSQHEALDCLLDTAHGRRPVPSAR